MNDNPPNGNLFQGLVFSLAAAAMLLHGVCLALWIGTAATGGASPETVAIYESFTSRLKKSEASRLN